MGNGEWGMRNGNGEWEIENGKWEIENGKLTFYNVEQILSAAIIDIHVLFFYVPRQNKRI